MTNIPKPILDQWVEDKHVPLSETMTNTQQLQDQIKEICGELEDEYARELGYEKYPSKMGRKIFIKRMVRRAFDLGWEASLNNQSSFTSTAITAAKREERERCVQKVHQIAVLGTSDHTSREISLLDIVIEALNPQTTEENT